MDFTPIVDLLSKNPLIGAVAVILFMAWVNSRMGNAGAANLTSALAFAGSQSVELNQKANLVIDLERQKGTLTAERDRARVERDQEKLEKDGLRDRIETLETQVADLARRAGQADFLDKRVAELQRGHDLLQKELDSKNKIITDLQVKLDTVQTELNKLRGQTPSAESDLSEPDFSILEGDELL